MQKKIEKILEKIQYKFGVDKSDAFEILSIATYCNMTHLEVNDNVRVTGQERGIDGVHFDVQNFKANITFFQCKNSDSLKENQLRKFEKDVQDIFIIGNPKDKGNLEGLKDFIIKYKSLSSEKNINHKYVFFYNGDKSQGNDLTIYNRNKSDDFIIWDRNDIMNELFQVKDIDFVFKPESSNLDLKNNSLQDLVSFSDSEINVFIFRLSAKELCSLLEKSEEINGNYQKIFSKNIRDYLGNTNIVNENMLNTIKNEGGKYFPVLNNGVTIICDNMEIPKSIQNNRFIIPTKNPVIINGLQTTNVIYQSYKTNSESIENIYVTVKLIETDNQELVDLITQATNTQSPINFRDKLSNKEFNKNAQSYFEIREVNYIIKNSDNNINYLDDSEKISISNTLVLNIWLSTFFEKPELFLDNHQKNLDFIYQAESNHTHLYHSLFNGDKESNLYSQLFFCYIIYREYHKIKNNKQVSTLPQMEGLILFGVYKELESCIDNLNLALIIKTITKISKIVNENFLEEVKKEEEKGSNKERKVATRNRVLSYYFKNQKSRYDLLTKMSLRFQNDVEITSKIFTYEVNIEKGVIPAFKK